MNRLQKKCVVATVGIHLLLLTILVVGPAFYNPQPKPDNTQVLDVIPANVIDAAFNSGVRNATPPAPVPAPLVKPPPVAPPPTPQVQNPPPTPPKPVEPAPTLPERIKNLFKSEPKTEPVKPAPTETKPEHKIQPNLTPVVRTASKNSPTNPKPDNSRNNAKVVNDAIRNLEKNLSPGTTIDLPGDSSVANASYAVVVKSVYDAAWTLPDTIAKDENILVSVTIASDGTVISSHIITPSGDAPADASVQRALDRVTTIGSPFPEGSTDKERTYKIIFNPQVKSSE